MMVMFSCFCPCSTLALSCDSSFYSSLVVMPTVFLRQSCQFSGEMWCLHITDSQVGQGVSFNLAGRQVHLSVCDDTETLIYIIWRKCADLLPYLHWLVILVILMDRLRTSVLYFWFNLEHLFVFYTDTSQLCFPFWMYFEQVTYSHTNQIKNIMFVEFNVITVNIFHTIWEEELLILFHFSFRCLFVLLSLLLPPSWFIITCGCTTQLDKMSWSIRWWWIR